MAMVPRILHSGLAVLNFKPRSNASQQYIPLPNLVVHAILLSMLIYEAAWVHVLKASQRDEKTLVGG
jgi:hypothetical protein